MAAISRFDSPPRPVRSALSRRLCELGLFRNFCYPRIGFVSSSVPNPPTEFVPSSLPLPAKGSSFRQMHPAPQLPFGPRFPAVRKLGLFRNSHHPRIGFVSSSVPGPQTSSFRHLYPSPQLPFVPRFPAARKLGLFRNFRHPRAGSVSSSVPGPPTGFVPSPLTQPPDRGSFRHFLHTQNWVRSVNLRYPRILPNSAPFSRRIRSVVAGSGSVLHSPRS